MKEQLDKMEKDDPDQAAKVMQKALKDGSIDGLVLVTEKYSKSAAKTKTRGIELMPKGRYIRMMVAGGAKKKKARALWKARQDVDGRKHRKSWEGKVRVMEAPLNTKIQWIEKEKLSNSKKLGEKISPNKAEAKLQDVSDKAKGLLGKGSREQKWCKGKVQESDDEVNESDGSDDDTTGGTSSERSSSESSEKPKEKQTQDGRERRQLAQRGREQQLERRVGGQLGQRL